MWHINKKPISCLIFCVVGLLFSNASASQNTISSIEFKVDSVLRLMTLDEKIGQLNQYSSYWSTGPVSTETNKLKDIQDGKVGSLLNVRGVDKTRSLQEIAMQSRLKIPLLFGMDVIHGYRTTFPIPLAEAASWDMEAIQLSAHIAATEAAASGIHWTFAPMVDICRDPRWGRVMEGAGEDTYLGCEIAKARVHGFQGTSSGKTDEVMACIKHFAGYGAAIGGRDYNAVDMSERTLWETYLPPFKAAVDAGAATIMNAFNDFNGIPCTGNNYLLRDILKGEWNFKGFVVSDWASIGEMIEHGYVEDKSLAAQSAITAGCDMDMESRCYISSLKELVLNKSVPESYVDDAVRRILRKKFELGLFDDPFKFCNEQRQKIETGNIQHREIAREVARKSIVMLKNESNILPLNKTQKIALIGPLAKSKRDMLGSWNVNWPDNEDVVTPYDGFKQATEKSKLVYAKGCELNDTSRVGFADAIATARQADVVVVCVGESYNMSGEARSRSDIHLPGVQEELVKTLISTGKPVVVLISAGRPLIFNWIADHAPAILYTWWLGSEAGNAISDLVFGKYNPSAKLPMTFPQTEGQIPVYYNYTNTGRPDKGDSKSRGYHTGYIDLTKEPKYPFGYGLSYSKFVYSSLQLSSSEMTSTDSVQVAFTLTNTSKVAGEEIVQLYIRDRVASVIRPVKELKAFRKIKLDSGESSTITFTINRESLSFIGKNLDRICEPGVFDLMIGESSANIKLSTRLILKN